VSNADWWAKKLGTPQAPVPQGRPVNNVPMPPTQVPMQAMPTFQQPQAPSKAQSANQSTPCPDCGSSNYMSPSPTIALRCYDCGYPVQQSGSRYGSLAGAHVEGATKAATGNDTVSNWNPQGIIGRIGD
jgi:ribosomal protein S27E